MLRVTRSPDPLSACPPTFPSRHSTFVGVRSEGENSIPADQAFSGEVTWKPSLLMWDLYGGHQHFIKEAALVEDYGLRQLLPRGERRATNQGVGCSSLDVIAR